MWSLFCRQFNVASCLQRVGYSVTACRGVWKFTCCELTPPHPRVTIQVDRRIVWLKVANYMTIRLNVPDTVTTYRYTIRIVSTFHLYDNILFLRPRARQGCVCMSVCPLARISQNCLSKLHKIFSFRVACDCDLGSDIFWQQCLCTSGFVEDVMCSHDRASGAESELCLVEFARCRHQPATAPRARQVPSSGVLYQTFYLRERESRLCADFSHQNIAIITRNVPISYLMLVYVHVSYVVNKTTRCRPNGT